MTNTKRVTDKTHPITPPPELVEQWMHQASGQPPGPDARTIATQAARWGADQELEACIDAILSHPGFEQPELFVEVLRAARRPKPPSLKEQALAIIEHAKDGWAPLPDDWDTIIRALQPVDG